MDYRCPTIKEYSLFDIHTYIPNINSKSSGLHMLLIEYTCYSIDTAISVHVCMRGLKRIATILSCNFA